MILNTGDDKLFLLMHSMDICVSVCAHYMIGTILVVKCQLALIEQSRKYNPRPHGAYIPEKRPTTINK